MSYKFTFLAATIAVLGCFSLQAQDDEKRRFEQLDGMLRSPNVYRTASGAPGHEYWQQQADYDIEVELNDENQSIRGKETITYTNNSPDVLTYLWVQLDQNRKEPGSDSYSTAASRLSEQMTKEGLRNIMGHDFDGGHKIEYVQDENGGDMKYTINKTMMRIDLPEPLESGEQVKLNIAWNYNINDRLTMGGRGGFELFEDGNYLYTITGWFPRMAVYSDYQGWQNKQFLGAGEFSLPFGDYKVSITVPADHIVASTGELQNASDILSSEQLDLFEQSKTADSPVIIVSQREAERKEKRKVSDKKTWVYHAENVRDFAFGSSRKYIWDAMGVDMNGRTVMAMSYYPKEANPLYERYSAEVVAQTLKTYSKYTIDYPYPVAISVEASNGMEYPMICFNYGRPEKDGTYSEGTKYGMISVIIHEVGHNFFPMIINSDERQWTWMDEGLNTFLQFLTEKEWDKNYPSRRGYPADIVPYMKGDKKYIRPIMTSSDNVVQLGPNAYGKPATALNILRETVMGRELFDYAFKEYARRWAFKHPTPEDFFRTMEDASAVDLDWFWRGWFFSVDHVDIALKSVTHHELNTKDPQVEKEMARAQATEDRRNITDKLNEEDIPMSVVEKKENMRDFYNTYDEFEVTAEDKKAYAEYMKTLDGEERALLEEGLHFYEITFENKGGLVMPLIIQFNYEDGTEEIERIPAEIWRRHHDEITKVFVKKKPVQQIVLDPYLETADTDLSNNYYPQQDTPSRFELYKRQSAPRGSSTGGNPMQRSNSR